MKQALKVMVVDDDTLALEVAAAALETRGHVVIKRDSALGTMLAIRRDKPDVVLLDVHMPGLTGDALTKLIVAAKGAHEPVIVLYSATDARELEPLAASCGAAGWIEKTSNPGEFLKRFAQLISDKLPRQGA
jgi:DNA-binding response OmpR family regulator